MINSKSPPNPLTLSSHHLSSPLQHFPLLTHPPTDPNPCTLPVPPLLAQPPRAQFLCSLPATQDTPTPVRPLTQRPSAVFFLFSPPFSKNPNPRPSAPPPPPPPPKKRETFHSTVNPTRPANNLAKKKIPPREKNPPRNTHPIDPPLINRPQPPRKLQHHALFRARFVPCVHPIPECAEWRASAHFSATYAPVRARRGSAAAGRSISAAAGDLLGGAALLSEGASEQRSREVSMMDANNARNSILMMGRKSCRLSHHIIHMPQLYQPSMSFGRCRPLQRSCP